VWFFKAPAARVCRRLTDLLLPQLARRRCYATIAQHIEALKAEASVSGALRVCALGLAHSIGACMVLPWLCVCCQLRNCLTHTHTQRLEELVGQLEPDIYTPDFVAEEVRVGCGANARVCGCCRVWLLPAIQRTSVRCATLL
jgi:hypothetical protein